MNINKQLPKDWKWVKLGETLDYFIGGDWGKEENYDDPNFGLAYCIRGSEIRNWDLDKGNTSSLRKIKLQNIGKRNLIEGDILVEISGGGPEQPVGRTVLIDKTVLSFNKHVPKICTNFLRMIRPKSAINSNFLNQYLKHFYLTGEIVKYQNGSNNLRNLKFPEYLTINIPLPPLPTQTQIVAKIETLFTQLDAAIQTLQTAQAQLKTYRQAVLKYAFEGKLTNSLNFDLNDLDDSHDLKTNQKNHSADSGNLPEGWKWVKLKDITVLVTDGDHQAPPKAKFGVPFITISNVNKNNNLIDFENTYFVESNYYKNLKDNRKPKKGDILYTVTGSFGIPVLVNFDKEFCFQRHIGLIRPLENVSQTWLYYLLQDITVYNQALNSATGTAQKTVALSSLRNFNIPFCDTKTQHLIIQAIESRLGIADKLQESINQSLAQAAALRQSILKKAFEGELV